MQIFARKSVNEFQIAVDGEETENVPTLTEHQIGLIFEARNKDLDLEYKERQFQKFKDKCNKISVNRRIYLPNVRVRTNYKLVRAWTQFFEVVCVDDRRGA